MKMAVIIPCYNGSAYLRRCLESVLSQCFGPGLVLVVDDASTDDSVAAANACGDKAAELGIRLEVIQNAGNLGFTRTANLGLRRVLSDPAGYDCAFLLNQDATVDPDCLAQLQALFVQHADVGAAGCKIFYPDRATLQHAGGYLARPRMVGLHFGHHQRDEPRFDELRDVDFVTGAAMALRTEVLRRVGLFDEVFSPGYYEDVDLCVRLREEGWRVVYCPRAVATHAESAAFSDWPARLALSQRNRLLFALRYMGAPSFRDEFEGAERAYLRADAGLDDLCSLALAYGRVLLMLQAALRMCLPGPQCTRADPCEIIRLLAVLREEALRAIRDVR